MIIGTFLSLASALAVSASPQATFDLSPVSQDPKQVLISYAPESARCDKVELALTDVVKTQIYIAWQHTASEPVVVQFRVDENGRPLGIKREGSVYASIGTDDVTAALAASRFAAGKARFGCSIKFAPKAAAIKDAALIDAFEYSVFPTSGRKQAVFDRIKSAASNCFDDRPDTLLRAYPDFTKIDALPGRFNWSMTQFDIGGDGKPASPKTIASSGNRMLDKASVEAVGKSRFGSAAKTACLYPYWRAPSRLAAPETPANEVYRPTNADCPLDVKWATKDPVAYPTRFNRRNIEGWAIIAFDVAPWGGTGNVQIAASEPALEFGEAAAAVIRQRKVDNGGKAMTGCVERVRFVMDPNRPFGTQDSLREGN
jgi:hypothetical protein